MKPTIYDIARVTGVSTATVSHVLNDTGRVGAATREKVLQKIRELGYEQNLVASALAGKNTHSIGFILPDINNPYFAEVVRGAEDEAFEKGYSVLICNTDHDPEKEQRYLRMLRQKRIDGLVIATGTTSPEVIEDLVSANVRIVLFSREIEGVRIATVTVDNFRGGYMAGKHLVELGHQSIGFINEPLSVNTSHDRLAGFQAAMQEAHAQVYVVSSDKFGITEGARLAAELLSMHEVTAIFAANDQLAVGALQHCRQVGKRVPDDISIVGFDGTLFSELVQPAITTVSQPMYELGKRTIQLLIESIENEVQQTEKVVLNPALIVRGSTKALSPG